MKRFSEYFKIDSHRIIECHPIIVYIASGLAIWGESNAIPVVFTSSITSASEDAILKRVSSTHRDGRAIDVSTRGWSKKQIDDAIRFLKEGYSHFGATGPNGENRLVVYHDSGTGFHLHIQINKQFTLPAIDFNS